LQKQNQGSVLPHPKGWLQTVEKPLRRETLGDTFQLGSKLGKDTRGGGEVFEGEYLKKKNCMRKKERKGGEFKGEKTKKNFVFTSKLKRNNT